MQTAVEGVTNNYARFCADWITELDRHDTLWLLLQKRPWSGKRETSVAGREGSLLHRIAQRL